MYVSSTSTIPESGGVADARKPQRALVGLRAFQLVRADPLLGPEDAREQARAAGVFGNVAADTIRRVVTLFEVFARNGAQSFMLGRSLYEDMLVAHWIKVALDLSTEPASELKPLSAYFDCSAVDLYPFGVTRLETRPE